jgi:two-component sensor histidine kinase
MSAQRRARASPGGSIDGSVALWREATRAHSSPTLCDVGAWQPFRGRANGGAPIPGEMLPIIFDPFRRANESLARRGGLGLGLYTSRTIVETLGGTIDARSDEHGTVFTVTLPRG